MSLYLNFSGAFITFLFGIWALIDPVKFSKIINLIPYKEKGITEIRTTYGGWILGLSIFTLINQNDLLFHCLGYGWLAAAIVRGIAMMFIDNSYSKKNASFVLIEILVGALLLI